MAIIRCPQCDATAQYTPKRRNLYTLSYSAEIISRCEVMSTMLKDKGSVSGAEFECPHLDKAADHYHNEQFRR